MASEYLPLRPLWGRLMHWAGFFGLSVVLIVTSAFLHFPDLIKGPLGIIGAVHVSSGFVLTALIATWAYLEWQIRDKRIRAELALSRSALRGAGRQIAFYSLPKRSPAEFKRMNPVQVILYHLWGVVFLLLLLTGISLWAPVSITGRGITNIVGGTHQVIGVHVGLAAGFLGCLIVHIYVAVLDAVITKNGSISSITARRH